LLCAPDLLPRFTATADELELRDLTIVVDKGHVRGLLAAGDRIFTGVRFMKEAAASNTAQVGQRKKGRQRHIHNLKTTGVSANSNDRQEQSTSEEQVTHYKSLRSTRSVNSRTGHAGGSLAKHGRKRGHALKHVTHWGTSYR